MRLQEQGPMPANSAWNRAALAGVGGLLDIVAGDRRSASQADWERAAAGNRRLKTMLKQGFAAAMAAAISMAALAVAWNCGAVAYAQAPAPAVAAPAAAAPAVPGVY